jgi:hypothetical protein
MQPETLVATAPQSLACFNTLAVKIPTFICAAFVAAVLVAQVEAIGYQANAVQPDAQSVYETMMVSP